MAVIIGHARGDEHGNARYGSAGDQKQSKTPDYTGQVSMSNWYNHSKGWVLIRAKDAAARQKIARNAQYACNNAYIGYDQSQNRTLYNLIKDKGFDCSKVKTKCETDCAQLVRACVRYAGIVCDDFYTVTEKDVLKKTGKFDIFTSDKYCKFSDYLLRGDILCTKTMGHTVIVLTDGAKAASEKAKYGSVATPATPAPAPSNSSSSSTSSSSCSNSVKQFQNFLNANYSSIIKKTLNTSSLAVDGSYGAKTRAVAVGLWKYMANKYYNADLTVGNSNFLTACLSAAKKMTDTQVKKHPTLGYIIQGVLAGRGFYSGNLDGLVGTKTQTAIKALEKAKGLTQDGKMDASTWNALFN